MTVRYTIATLRELPRDENFTVVGQFATQSGSYSNAVVVSGGVLDALLAATEAARDLADLVAHVVCEPDSFNENAQLLSECVDRARDALANFEFDHQSNGVAVSTQPEKHDDPATSKGV